jgi:RimJ/RimL family protein N-acetyltransferase
MLYDKHKEAYGNQYDFIVTEIATRNTRSIRAHEKIGFKTIHQFTDATDDWDIVLWDWK